MVPSDEKPPAEPETGEKHAPVSDFLRMIEEYARDLRQAIQKLRKKLH